MSVIERQGLGDGEFSEDGGKPEGLISTAELRDRLDEPGLTIVDVRPLAAYNGWRLRGEARGGHIPGAVAFPSALARQRRRRRDRPPAASRRRSSPAGTIVLYGDRRRRRPPSRHGSLASSATRASGSTSRAWPAWAADATLPLERLPNYDKLVHTAWLRELLDGGRPEAAPTGPVPALPRQLRRSRGVRGEPPPRARSTSTRTGSRIRSTGTAARRRSSRRRCASLGITHDTTVILYGRDTEGDANEKWPGRRAGQIAATRAALILRYCRRRRRPPARRRLRLVGPRRATRSRPCRASRSPSPPSASPIPQRPELIVDIDEAKEILADQEGAALVSVRTWSEHIGAVSGYNYIGPAGRIAGDVWGNCGTDAYHMQHYRNVDNTMRAYPEIAANWAEAGITADKWVAFYCGTGWRASETWFYAYLHGLAADRRLRRRLVRVERGPGQQPDRDRRARADEARRLSQTTLPADRLRRGDIPLSPHFRANRRPETGASAFACDRRYNRYEGTGSQLRCRWDRSLCDRTRTRALAHRVAMVMPPLLGAFRWRGCDRSGGDCSRSRADHGRRTRREYVCTVVLGGRLLCYGGSARGP